MASNKKYWKSVEELNENSSIVETLQQNEFVEPIPTDEFLGDKETLEASSTTRRDFLKYVGFTTAAAAAAACEGPVIKSIPYVVAPDEIVPGVANYYASTIADGFDFANVLVKTREGRPIKIERNDLSKTGGVNARVHASVLSLYDNNRLKAPLVDGAEVTWEEFDTKVAQKMNEMTGKDIVLLTQTFASPSTSKLIKEFTAKYPNVRHVVYDTVSSSEALEAFQSTYGVRGLADYDFSKAEVIVSVGADFLGDWQGGGYEGGYAKGRVPKKGKMSRHVQFEANMTLSGANADKRVPVTPSQQLQIVKALTGNGSTSGLSEKVAEAVNNAKAQLRNAGANGVLVTGCPDVSVQKMVLAYNQGVASKAMDAAKPRMTRQGNAAQVASVMNGILSGTVKGIITVGVDPVYSFPAKGLKEAYKNLEMSMAFSMKKDATASVSQLVAATPHYLESWGDAQIKKGTFSLMQPTIRPLFNTRQFQDSLLQWTGNSKKYYDYIKETWSTVLGGASWNKTLEAGVFESTADVSVEEVTASGEDSMESMTSNGAFAATSQNGGLELTLYTKTGLGDGQQANNPWLQELPDPITRTTWDNYLTISKADAEAYGLENYNVANGALNGSKVHVKMGDVTIENVPVLIQPGQAKGSVGLALGYGKTAAIQEQMQTGVNAYALYQNFSSVQNVSIEKASGADHEFACIQLQNTMMGRDIIRETTLEIFNTKDVEHWNPMPMVSKDHQEIPVTSEDADLWEPFDRSVGHHFNLSIDLNACTGCGACVIACNAENNVPVVGKQEMRKSRNMHWLRIDRYYSSEDSFDSDLAKKEGFSGLTGDNGSLGGFGELEDPAANPQVAFQPVMCQHCNHAPCETVCPVAATSHGRQGQNHMAYNRCVGTRYCANNCPYKVRRFNWFLYNENDEFDYHMNNDLGRMVLNPDVVVRSRGVMEKCSMCIQMTQKTILDAKRDGRAVKPNEFKTACSAACDSGALVFGDINDHDSDIYTSKNDNRMYHLLEAVGTEPNVFYKTKVRNTKEV
ncbi:TAT-variant-translocated molybdopterin oxidoreductase [Patiriisocius hiemis]|uniref:TAT-variant-translocated molybdopterin oxidoreductase n=1 Tax=Patiriisocius hiemis TaxID=3075604 RepID=A0ABU2YAN0_9FLAO|nr:TAT-variant-translocated molybdopterin oxidoreductase [Constantimarinum sp. W242]MDT0555246.1 TAT-variant-translocated molybdopterin oxidoreductase [Constantimarinum sp. W242]